MIKKEIFVIILVVWIFLNSAFPQVAGGGLPYLLKNPDLLNSSKENINTIKLDCVDNIQEIERAEKISNKNCENCKNKYCGTSIDVSIDLISESTGINTLRIHFSKWGQHWYSTNSNNQLWENAAVIWKNANYPQDVDCNWHQAIFEITVPSNMPDLGEMIIYCAEGAFFIDDIELYKKCSEIILVQNHEINIFNQPRAYSASDKIIAGNSVAPSYQSGDVIVSSSGSVEFVAGNEVRLKHGFKISGGCFHAYNDICGNNKVNTNKIL